MAATAEVAEPRRTRGRLIGGIVVVLTVLVATAGLLRLESGNRPLESRPDDRMAPDFELPLLTEGDVRLSDLRGSPVVLNFWASWCGPCKDEAEVLADGSRRWSAEGVKFLGVDIKDSKRWALEFKDRYGIEFPSGFDATGVVERRYGVTGIPETFFVRRDGRIAAKWVGPIKEEQLDRLVRLILDS